MLRILMALGIFGGLGHSWVLPGDRVAVYAVVPPYEESLRGMRYEGDVRLEVIADAAGAVAEARVLDSFAPADYNEVFVEYARKWRFEAGQKVTSELVTFSYRLIREDTSPGELGVAFQSPARMQVRRLRPGAFELIDPKVKKPK